MIFFPLFVSCGIFYWFWYANSLPHAKTQQLDFAYMKIQSHKLIRVKPTKKESNNRDDAWLSISTTIFGLKICHCRSIVQSVQLWYRFSSCLLLVAVVVVVVAVVAVLLIVVCMAFYMKNALLFSLIYTHLLRLFVMIRIRARWISVWFRDSSNGNGCKMAKHQMEGWRWWWRRRRNKDDVDGWSN